MIRKILTIDNIGRFEHCAWRGGLQFESMSIIFAENGRGKSTFCDVLRSYQTGIPDFILGRRRLGASKDSEVAILLDGSNKATFQNGKWDNTEANLAIFDTAFVHQNVYAGDRVDHEHKKNLYRVIVGETGVKLAEKVDRLDADARDATKEIQSKLDAITRRVPPKVNIDSFLQSIPDAEIAAKLANKSNELKNAELAFKRSAEIKAKGLLQKVSLPSFPEAFDTTLSEKVSNLSDSAESQLRKHLADHTKGGTETWISQGLSFQKSDECPFCGQDTKGISLISSFRAFFDAAYDRLKRRLTDLDRTMASSFGERVTLEIQKTSGENATLSEFWRQLDLGKELQSPEISAVGKVITELRDQARQLLQSKISTPVEPVEVTEEFRDAFQAFTTLQDTAKRYNETIDKLNGEIAAYKAKLETVDLSKLRAELNDLQLNELRGSTEIMTAVNEYNEAKTRKSNIEKAKDAAKADLDNYGNKVLAEHETRINELLRMFAAGFRIVHTERSYVGGKPSSNFKLIINEVPVELGDEKTPFSVPSFRNTLSSGDRSTLALALFFAQLERDPNLKDKIVVFDDPLTSQDRSRRTATQTLICNCARKVAQVFVLSHDPQFLRGIWDSYKGGGAVQSFQFFRMGKGTSIGEWNVVKETTGEYAKKHRILWDYKHNPSSPKASPREIAQMIRPLLEEYLRLKLPQSFADNEWLGDFISKIRKADPSDPVAAASGLLERLEWINEYSKRYHHSTNAASASEIIDEAELMTYVSETLDLVGGF